MSTRVVRRAFLPAQPLLRGPPKVGWSMWLFPVKYSRFDENGRMYDWFNSLCCVVGDCGEEAASRIVYKVSTMPNRTTVILPPIFFYRLPISLPPLNDLVGIQIASGIHGNVAVYIALKGVSQEFYVSVPQWTEDVHEHPYRLTLEAMIKSNKLHVASWQHMIVCPLTNTLVLP
jgi:hypothetical protein